MKRNKIKYLLDKKINNTNITTWNSFKSIKEINFFKAIDIVLILMNIQVEMLIRKLRLYLEDSFILKNNIIKDKPNTLKDKQKLLLKYYKN